MTTTRIDIGKVRAEILSGRHDQDLSGLVQAVRERVRQEQTLAWRWKITLGDDEWTEETVTLAEIQVVEKVTGKSWLELNPTTSAVHLAAYMYAHLVRGGTSDDEARRVVDSMSVMAAADCVDQYVTELAPKGSPATSTKP